MALVGRDVVASLKFFGTLGAVSFVLICLFGKVIAPYKKSLLESPGFTPAKKHDALQELIGKLKEREKAFSEQVESIRNKFNEIVLDNIRDGQNLARNGRFLDIQDPAGFTSSASDEVLRVQKMTRETNPYQEGVTIGRSLQSKVFQKIFEHKAKLDDAIAYQESLLKEIARIAEFYFDDTLGTLSGSKAIILDGYRLITKFI